MAKETVHVGCGCLPFIVLVFILWAIFFGVTVDGKHHGISCSCDDGVKVSDIGKNIGKENGVLVQEGR